MVTLTFGEKLMLLRKKSHISQRKLAETLGISFNNIFRYEKGNYLPKPELLIKLSKVFNVSIDYLLLDKHQTTEILDFKDNEMIDLIKSVDNLTEKEKGRLKNLIKSYMEDHKE